MQLAAAKCWDFELSGYFGPSAMLYAALTELPGTQINPFSLAGELREQHSTLTSHCPSLLGASSAQPHPNVFPKPQPMSQPHSLYSTAQNTGSEGRGQGSHTAVSGQQQAEHTGAHPGFPEPTSSLHLTLRIGKWL